jgi:ribosomal protein S18 acetylase RimI-like enzyme
MDTIQSSTMDKWLNQVEIRHLTHEDLPALEWEGEYTHFRKVYADAYQRVVAGLSVVWVADLAGTGIIGQVLVQLICDRPELADGSFRAYVYAFRVRPPYRSMGLGSRIMHVVEDDLHGRGFQVVTLNVAKDNPRARELYERLGYLVVAHEPGVWSYQDHLGNWRQVNEPAWRMEKTLR